MQKFLRGQTVPGPHASIVHLIFRECYMLGKLMRHSGLLIASMYGEDRSTITRVRGP